ncbi:MAG TPA: hypothetical protein VFG50_06240 [Rhodothermales bacterium]|nr:hypothetical protein [Rhodothermales bacterium]
MPTKTLEITGTPVQVRELLALVAEGEEILLTRGGEPFARLVPVGSASARKEGLHPHSMQMSADFDEEMPDSFWIKAPVG